MDFVFYPLVYCQFVECGDTYPESHHFWGQTGLNLWNEKAKDKIWTVLASPG